MRRQKSKSSQFTEIAESMGLLGNTSADMPVPNILEVFLKRANGDKYLALERIQEYLEKLSPHADPEYVSKIRRVKLRLEEM